MRICAVLLAIEFTVETGRDRRVDVSRLWLSGHCFHLLADTWVRLWVIVHNRLVTISGERTLPACLTGTVCGAALFLARAFGQWLYQLAREVYAALTQRIPLDYSVSKYEWKPVVGLQRLILSLDSTDLQADLVSFTGIWLFNYFIFYSA